ncbi:hypothetical protein [Merismopedia glauca]|uniref:Uncharacterized protein n=1 Tax=Merismopedia glauca CCAP 1448/3 TaxID=1296344 RepID=A0A2T1C561_9CYAN|nr:hypothetical protein C7B64_08665 [Merismopedia glauca CCAP 1448/3]
MNSFSLYGQDYFLQEIYVGFLGYLINLLNSEIDWVLFVDEIRVTISLVILRDRAKSNLYHVHLWGYIIGV